MSSIVEVAKLAGVSHSTVSRVINNNASVAPEHVKAVKAAMAKLQYTLPNRRRGPKRGARAKRPNGISIGLLLLDASSDHATLAFERLMLGISKGAAYWNVRVVFQSVTDPESLLTSVSATPVDGLLLYGPAPSAAVCEKLSKYPTVWLMGNRRRPDWGDQIIPDHYDIGGSAARYLQASGHSQLAFINLDKGFWPYRVTRQAFATSAKNAGGNAQFLEIGYDGVSDSSPILTEDVDSLVQRFLQLKPQPTGIFVVNDMQVAVVQPALQRAGVKIGRGAVEIISCNNERPYLAGLSPVPADIDIRVEAIGYHGVERLLWRLQNPGMPANLVTSIQPVVLNSSGKPFLWSANR